MADLSFEDINEKYFDVLKEIGNIGAGNATTAIANMLNLRLDMKVPKVELIAVEKIGSAIGSEEQIVVGILLGVENDINGSMMFLMDLPSAHHLVNRLMMRDPEYNEDFDEMDLSAKYDALLQEHKLLKEACERAWGTSSIYSHIAFAL
ncbi:MAG: chemotaxis protein CheC, partial [Lachnospiraceae bacterium]|nr:chemotaxis protein CheC [Lachnospiraceae bacterium]